MKEEEAMAHVAGYVIVNEFSLPEDSYYRPAVKARSAATASARSVRNWCRRRRSSIPMRWS